jgi:hypothetical protein
MFRGKPKPPRLAEAALKDSRLKGGKDAGQAGMKGSRDAAKAAAKPAKGTKGESGGNLFKAAGEKIKNAAKGARDAVRGSGKPSRGDESGGAVKSGAPGRKPKPSGLEMDSTVKPGGGDSKGGGGGRR